MHTVLMARNLIFDCPYLPQGIMNLKATLLLKKICFLRVVAHLKQGSFAFEVLAAYFIDTNTIISHDFSASSAALEKVCQLNFNTMLILRLMPFLLKVFKAISI